MNIMNLYVYENRSMSNDLSKPLMLENLSVDNVQIHIPKEIDGTDMGTWAWWFVYQNAKREKYSIPMTLEGTTSDDGEEEYISTVGLNHGFTGKHGTVMYAIEAVQADGSGAVTHEWHTKTYKLEIVYTLQGNQTEYDESESDIISALISRVNELIQSGAEIAEIAETIENAAETAQEVIDSIPADYSELSAQVDTNTEDIGGLKADLGGVRNAFNSVSGADIPAFTAGGLYAETGIEYNHSSRSRTTFIKVKPNSYITFLFPFDTPNFLRVYEFADNTTTTQDVNTKLATQYAYNGDTCQMSARTNFIRIQVDAAPSAVTGVVLWRGGGYQRNQFLGLNYNDATQIVGTSEAHADLNNYKTPGNYVVVSAAIATYVDNAPLTNGGYKLVVMQTSALNRIFQLLIPNSGRAMESKIYFRNCFTDDNTGWNPWVDVTNPQDVVKSSGISVDSSNYINYFPNSKFSDITTNAIIWIGSNVPLTDGPAGDQWIGTAERTSGYVNGTLIVLTPRNHHGYGKGLVQILLGYRDTSYKPTLSYRVATYNNGEYVWSDWSKFEENGYLRASNVIVYGGSLDKSISDLNDMPSNTIYQLDLNLNGSDADHTLLHHPAPGVSCVAMCYAFSYTSQHGKVQTVYTIDGRLYWRYGYLQAPGDYRWTSWQRVVSDAGDYLRNKGRLDNGTDLNTIKENAIYMLGGQSGANYVNNPITSGAGYLTAKHNSDVTLQIVESLSGTRYSRYTDDGTTWSNWI